MAKMKSTIERILFILLIIGGLNWGLVGITDMLGSSFNLILFLFDGLLGWRVISNIIFIFVGLSALYLIKLLRQ